MFIHPDPDGAHRRRRKQQRRKRHRRPRRNPSRLRRGLLAVLGVLLGAAFAPPLLLRVIDPPRTAFMLAAELEAWRAGNAGFRLDYRWRDLEAISPWAALAVVAAEDQKFPVHHGFDLDAIGDALEAHADGARLRGASTLSQQLAKNLFLWSGRSWLRKALEAGYTALLELVLPKRRILELYLNVAEFGPGVYGVQAAARRYFDRDAADLDRNAAALLATVLPDPRRRRVRAPSPGMRERQAWIIGQMQQLGGRAYLDGML